LETVAVKENYDFVAWGRGTNFTHPNLLAREVEVSNNKTRMNSSSW